MKLVARFLPIVLLFAVNYPAVAEPFAFEGFYPGMPLADATKLHPEAPWQLAAPETPTEGTRKEFASNHLGREASVSIVLDGEGQFVRLIGFTFHSQSDGQCLLEAVFARMQLERLYGTAAETSSEQFGKRARWNTGDGVTLRWMEACTVGAREYFVTYAKPAG